MAVGGVGLVAGYPQLTLSIRRVPGKFEEARNFPNYYTRLAQMEKEAEEFHGEH